MTLNKLRFAFVLSVLFCIGFTSQASAAEFSVQVFVGDNKPGPKTDQSAAHLAKSLEKLNFQNFTSIKNTKVNIPLNQVEKIDLGHDGLFIQVTLQEIKDEKAVFKLTLLNGKDPIFEQTMKVALNKAYIVANPVGNKCVVVSITYTKP